MMISLISPLVRIFLGRNCISDGGRLNAWIFEGIDWRAELRRAMNQQIWRSCGTSMMKTDLRMIASSLSAAFTQMLWSTTSNHQNSVDSRPHGSRQI
jgi:hypothetical protein